jgi:hypothetical protein
VADRAKKVLSSLAKSASVEVLRGYVAKRIRAVQVDDILKAIETNDTDIIGKLSERDKKLFVTLASKFGKYLDLLTVKNVMLWLVEDAPLHAGVIYGHPEGLKWLSRVLEQIRSQALKYAASSTEVELEPVQQS